ncbi:NFACT family protein, partial [Candidatus Woesearchaeota archaeon]|nr:NFACT family protein [Candidatus Woesearchaeota archaeon]
MERQLSSAEICIIVKELQVLIGGRLNQLYQPDDKELLLDIFKSGIGRRYVSIRAQGMIYVSSAKPEMPEKPKSFCVALRKRIHNATVIGIEQAGSERLVEFRFRTKEGEWKLVAELFGKGNIILLKENVIAAAAEQSERVVKNAQYAYPPGFRKAGVLEQLEPKADLAGTLATKLGKAFADELCLRAGMKPNSSPSPDALKRAQTVLSELLAKPEPIVLLKDGVVVDALPFPMRKYAGLDVKPAETFSQALGTLFGSQKTKAVTQKISAMDKQRAKLQTIIELQQKSAEKLEAEAVVLQQHGEAVYSNYQQLQELLRALGDRKALVEFKKSKQHPLVKDINEKT